MRHRKAGRKLKRTSSHRRALLAALSTELLRHKRITTTVIKAKETRMVVEKIITRAKNAIGNTDAPAVALHARREVGRLIKDRAVIKELFSAIVEKVAQRSGGYTRIVKLGQRQGDGAEMAVIELVDFNTGQDQAEKPAEKETKSAKPKKAASPKKPQAAAGESKSKKKGADEDSTKKESR
ncbi:MAG: 50S ribosomal protein L17 [Bacteroidota bacterium]